MNRGTRKTYVTDVAPPREPSNSRAFDRAPHGSGHLLRPHASDRPRRGPRIEREREPLPASTLRSIRCVGAVCACAPELKQSGLAAIGGEFDNVVVGMSGGLDFSIVYAALAATGQRFTALTVYSDDPSGDERAYLGLFGAYNAGPGRYAAYLEGRRALPGEARHYLRRVTGSNAPWPAREVPTSVAVAVKPKSPDPETPAVQADIFFIRR